jgi:hypothetical protein
MLIRTACLLIITLFAGEGGNRPTQGNLGKLLDFWILPVLSFGIKKPKGSFPFSAARFNRRNLLRTSIGLPITKNNLSMVHRNLS